MDEREPPAEEAVERERFQILAQLEDWLETPLFVLGLAWLALLVIDLTRGLTPGLQTATTVIWIVFILDFLLKLVLAPRKLAYLRSNWLTALALVLPALRVLRFARVFRVARAARGLRLARVLTSINRGMRSLRAAMRRRGVGYVTLLTILVAFVGAAGMYAFESPAEGGGLATYAEALWWTAMLLTTAGSDYWPQTPEGRALCFLLALYAFAVFGYLAATLTSFFVDRDAEAEDSAVAGAEELRRLRMEVEGLREEIRRQIAEREP
ncbi:MAG TPA: ion transporter [Thermoanaerobaculia bacterium]|nr:ion transporter [Thermoanaerobaculia bacterium]